MLFGCYTLLCEREIGGFVYVEGQLRVMADVRPTADAQHFADAAFCVLQGKLSQGEPNGESDAPDSHQVGDAPP